MQSIRNATFLNNRGPNRGPAWSPDGKKIAFTRWTGRAWNVHLMDADGGNLTSLTDSPFYDADLNWARDSLVKQISDGLKYVAISEGAEFLDLRDSLQGREVCATASRQATSPTCSRTRASPAERPEMFRKGY